MGLSLLNNPRPNTEHIYESRGEQREENIEEEAKIGFQSKDTGADTEERRSKVVQGCESLWRRRGKHCGLDE